jgi:hypothetical protein
VFADSKVDLTCVEVNLRRPLYPVHLVQDGETEIYSLLSDSKNSETDGKERVLFESLVIALLSRIVGSVEYRVTLAQLKLSSFWPY